MREASETRPYASGKVNPDHPLRSVWSYEKYEVRQLMGLMATWFLINQELLEWKE